MLRLNIQEWTAALSNSFDHRKNFLLYILVTTGQQAGRWGLRVLQEKTFRKSRHGFVPQSKKYRRTRVAFGAEIFGKRTSEVQGGVAGSSESRTIKVVFDFHVGEVTKK